MRDRSREYATSKRPYLVTASRDGRSMYHDRSFSTLRLAEMAAQKACRRGYDAKITHHDYSDPTRGVSKIIREYKAEVLPPFDEEN